MDLTLLHDVTYGMYIIGADNGGTPVGCVANTIAQITSANPSFMISLNKNNYTYKVIDKYRKFSVSILGENTRPELIGTFGFQSSEHADKYKDCSFDTVNGIPFITENCSGALFFDVIDTIDMETHCIILGRLTDTKRNESLKPMTYSYYHTVVKGKAPKAAPTYQPDEEEKDSAAYVCDICGYIYEGDISKESKDYRCPICKADLSHFKEK